MYVLYYVPTILCNIIMDMVIYHALLDRNRTLCLPAYLHGTALTMLTIIWTRECHNTHYAAMHVHNWSHWQFVLSCTAFNIFICFHIAYIMCIRQHTSIHVYIYMCGPIYSSLVLEANIRLYIIIYDM